MDSRIFDVGEGTISSSFFEVQDAEMRPRRKPLSDLWRYSTRLNIMRKLFSTKPWMWTVPKTRQSKATSGSPLYKNRDSGLLILSSIPLKVPYVHSSLLFQAPRP